MNYDVIQILAIFGSGLIATFATQVSKSWLGKKLNMSPKVVTALVCVIFAFLYWSISAVANNSFATLQGFITLLSSSFMYIIGIASVIYNFVIRKKEVDQLPLEPNDTHVEEL